MRRADHATRRDFLCQLGGLGGITLAQGSTQAENPTRPLPTYSVMPCWISAFSFSANGQLLAVAAGGYTNERGKATCKGSTLALWDTKTREKVLTLSGHPSHITSITFSPDGKILAASDFHSIRMWEVKTGKTVAELNHSRLNDEPAYSIPIVFSPDGKTLAANVWPNLDGEIERQALLHRPGVVQLWDMESRKVRTRLEGHASTVRALVFSPDGKTLAAASGKYDKVRERYVTGEIKLWDPMTGKVQRTLTGHTREIQSVACSGDGKTLATGSAVWDKPDQEGIRGEVKLWDVATGRARLTTELNRNYVQTLAFSPNGRLLAAGSGDIVVNRMLTEERDLVLLDGQTLRSVAILSDKMGPSVSNMAFSPNGRVLSVDASKEVKMWDVSGAR